MMKGNGVRKALFFDYHRKYGTEVKVIRIFNTYGPHMSINDGRVISNFITQGLQNKDITIYGNGRQTRSYMYIDDLIEGMIRLMETPQSVTGPLNIGRPQEITVTDLAKLVKETIKESTSSIIYLPLPKDDPCKRCPDITNITETLNGWYPNTTLEKGIIKTIDYFKKEIQYERHSNLDYISR